MRTVFCTCRLKIKHWHGQKDQIEASSGLTDAEIKRWSKGASPCQWRQACQREGWKLNKADSMIFQTEKQLKEFGDKLSGRQRNRHQRCVGETEGSAQIAGIVATIDTALAVRRSVAGNLARDVYRRWKSGGVVIPQIAGAANAGCWQWRERTLWNWSVPYEEVNDKKWEVVSPEYLVSFMRSCLRKGGGFVIKA